MFQLIWLGGGGVTALAVVFDMRRLGTRRVGLPPIAWGVASVCLGPIAGAIYLSRRSAARQALIDAVWLLVGDRTVPDQVRRERLIALASVGVVGPVIYRACAAVLHTEPPVEAQQITLAPSRVTDNDLSRPL
ncbi:hypothetical protein [Burkholderia glumae]|uniref:hypothetical protein n=1 Tax=Burkholderia glumae TaxID=337 RepID=UPI0020371CA0|nr:hypothetical protein [Burkholderia glumae]MCM2496194.1 hypothetical protein [Burkholderia glumae]